MFQILLRHVVRSARQICEFARRYRVLLGIMVLGALFFGAIATVRYLGMHDTVYDLTIFNQAIANYAHFRAPASYARGVQNLLGDHFHPILMLLVPFYWLFPSPYMLVIAQVLLLMLAVPAVYGFARSVGHTKRWSLALAFTAQFSAGFLFMVDFDFHELAFAVPLLAWAIYALYAKKTPLLTMMLVGFALTKENLFFVIAALGLVLIVKRQVWKGVATAVSGVLGYMLVAKLVISYFAGGASYGYWTYTALGPDALSALKNVVINPVHALTLAVSAKAKLLLFAKTFGPVLGLSIFSPLIIVCVPLLGERVFSSNPNLWVYGYHYQGLLGLVVFMAAVEGLANAARYLGAFRYKTVVINGLKGLVVLLGLGMLLYVVRFTALESGYSVKVGRLQALSAAVAPININAKVCTTNRVGSYIPRQYVFAIEWLTPHTVCNVLVYNDSLDGGQAAMRAKLGGAYGSYRQTYNANGWHVLQK